MEAVAPPTGAESWAARLVRLFEVYLVLSAAVCSVFIVATWKFLDPRAAVLTASLLAATVALGVLSRLAWARVAAVAYLTALWLFVTLSLCFFGAFRSPAAAGYTVVALGAALLFGPRGGAVSTLVVVASCLLIAVADSLGWLPKAG